MGSTKALEWARTQLALRCAHTGDDPDEIERIFRQAAAREVVAELRTGWIGEVWGSDALEIADGIESKFLPRPKPRRTRHD